MYDVKAYNNNNINNNALEKIHGHSSLLRQPVATSLSFFHNDGISIIDRNNTI